MPRYQVFGEGGEVMGFVEVDAAPAAAGGAQLLAHPLVANDGPGIELLPADDQRAAFIGFADRDYVAGETFEHNWGLPLGGEAVDVVYASVALCKQVNPFSFAIGDPAALVVVAARDESARIAIPVVAPDGIGYTSVLEVSPIPTPQTIARGDPLWIVWAVNTTTTQPTFFANALLEMAPFNAQALNAGWDPLNEIGAPATTFTQTVGETPIRGFTKPPIP